MLEPEIDPLQNNHRDKAEGHRDQTLGQFQRVDPRIHGGVDHRDAPGQKAHGGNGRLGNDHGRGAVKFHLFVEGQHDGENNQIGGATVAVSMPMAAIRLVMAITMKIFIRPRVTRSNPLTRVLNMPV